MKLLKRSVPFSKLQGFNPIQGKKALGDIILSLVFLVIVIIVGIVVLVVAVINTTKNLDHIYDLQASQLTASKSLAKFLSSPASYQGIPMTTADLILILYYDARGPAVEKPTIPEYGQLKSKAFFDPLYENTDASYRLIFYERKGQTKLMLYQQQGSAFNTDRVFEIHTLTFTLPHLEDTELIIAFEESRES
ncbi:MAG: hypothetical protein QW594_04385 [Candidatus Woesearchaeota archaeon]